MAKKATDPLDALAGDPLKVIALMLWKNRMREPDMYAQITPDDIQAYEDCVAYLKVTPQINITHPAGEPAQAAVPATANRRAVPARPATPPKPFVIVTLTDKNGDMIKPIENNQVDYDESQHAQKIQHAKSVSADLAQRIIHQAQSGETSLSDTQDAANALILLGAVA